MGPSVHFSATWVDVQTRTQHAEPKSSYSCSRKPLHMRPLTATLRRQLKRSHRSDLSRLSSRPQCRRLQAAHLVEGCGFLLIDELRCSASVPPPWQCKSEHNDRCISAKSLTTSDTSASLICCAVTSTYKASVYKLSTPAQNSCTELAVRALPSSMAPRLSSRSSSGGSSSAHRSCGFCNQDFAFPPLVRGLAFRALRSGLK